jgi:hypothetical protein
MAKKREREISLEEIKRRRAEVLKQRSAELKEWKEQRKHERDLVKYREAMAKKANRERDGD